MTSVPRVFLKAARRGGGGGDSGHGHHERHAVAMTKEEEQRAAESLRRAEAEDEEKKPMVLLAAAKYRAMVVPPIPDPPPLEYKAAAATGLLPFATSMIITPKCGAIEGYWALFYDPLLLEPLTHHDGIALSSPVPYKEPFSTLAPFWTKLEKVQRAIDNGRSEIGRVVSYWGGSKCRICPGGCFVGGKEYTIPFKYTQPPPPAAAATRESDWYYPQTLSWPVGYAHYGSNHNIVPSKPFFDAICALSLL